MFLDLYNKSSHTFGVGMLCYIPYMLVLSIAHSFGYNSSPVLQFSHSPALQKQHFPEILHLNCYVCPLLHRAPFCPKICLPSSVGRSYL